MHAQSFSRKDLDFEIITVLSHISTLNPFLKHELWHEKWDHLKGRLHKAILY